MVTTWPGTASQGTQSATQDRGRLPGLQAPADQDGPREHRLRPRGHGHAPRPHLLAVQRALRLVGLVGQADQFPRQLSGGEQQWMAIALAPAHDPRLVIADEPTGNLDPLISWEILQLLLRINELGVTVLMATHDADIVTALRKRVVALEDGRIIRDEIGGGYHRPGLRADDPVPRLQASPAWAWRSSGTTAR